MVTKQADNLQFLLTPSSIAIVGASDHVDKIGGRPLYYMRKHGYQGTIYPINPNRSQIQGEPAWPSLSALPEVPELAIIAVAGQHTLNAVKECADLGVKGAIIISAGFSEVGPEGKAQQDRMVAIAQAAGLRLVGPNSQGLANFGSGAIASFSTMFLEHEPQDGPVAVISQSGGMSAMVYGLLRERGIGVRHMHATGNEADVTVADMATAVLDDPTTKVICLYLESVQDAQGLEHAATRAKAQGIPLVAVKSGTTQAGMKAAQSHTGALANEDRLVTAFFKKHGIIRAQDPQEMARLAEFIVRNPLPTGKNTVIVSNSGASCVLACDAAARHDLPLPSLANETQKELEKVLASFATTNNPIDITAALLSNNRLFAEVLGIVGKDEQADVFVLDIPVAGRGYDVDAFAQDAKDFTEQFKKPVVLVAWQKAVAKTFRDHGIPVYDDELQAMRLISLITNYAAALQQPATDWQVNVSTRPQSTGATRTLSEKESLDMLAQIDLPIVEHQLVENEAQALAAWQKIGAPSVIKACSEALAHKSEYGLVALNINDAERLKETLKQQQETLTKHQIAADGWIVAKQEKGLQEATVGAYVDDVFGPVVVIGSGGKYVEALPDVAILIPPFSVEEVLAELKHLRLGVLLAGVRGEPAADAQALAEMAVKVGQFIMTHQDRIHSLDINPVLVKEQGVVAVDALVEVLK